MTTLNLVVLVTSLALIGLERVGAWKRVTSPFLRPGFGSDIAFLVVSWLAGAGLSLSYIAWASEAVGPRFTLPLWSSALLALVLLDLGNWIAHRAMHRFDFLWELHKVHHSSPTLDWLATFRSHLLEQTFRRIFAPIFLIALGMPIRAVALAAGFLFAWGMFNHANVRFRLRFLEPIFITPRLHHVHHGMTTSDRNFGTVFSLWDRIAGRLVTSDVRPDAPLGVPDEGSAYPRGFFAQMRAPFQRLLVRSVAH